VFGDLGAIVLKKRGEVIVDHTVRMPANSGAAATCRF